MEAESLTAILRVCTFTLLALLMFRLCEHERALERNLTLLQGLLPLCSHCKRIKNAAMNGRRSKPTSSHARERSSLMESARGAPANSTVT